MRLNLDVEVLWHRPRFLAAVIARLYGERIRSLPRVVTKRG